MLDVLTIVALYLAIVGAFANLRKATSSFVMSVHPSIRLHRTTRLLPNGC